MLPRYSAFILVPKDLIKKIARFSSILDFSMIPINFMNNAAYLEAEGTRFLVNPLTSFTPDIIHACKGDLYRKAFGNRSYSLYSFLNQV